MFCPTCGTRLSDNCAFCSVCGNPIGAVRPAPVTAPGFSEKIRDPAIQAMLKKNRKGTVIFAVLLVLAPILVTLIIGLKDDDLSVVGYGAIVSGIFLLVSLISLLKKKGEKQWEGTVTEKRVEVRKKKNDSDRVMQTENIYVTRFSTANGKTKKLEEPEINHIWFDYLNVGDYVRYHPQFNCYYEKYDKSRDTYAICPMCNTKNGISEAVCSRCGVPIIK